MMDCDILINKYLKAVSENSEIKKIGDNCILITPYLHSHGVYIAVFANEIDNGIRIHDNGETLQSLFTRGVKVYGNPTKEELLNDICKTYKVDVSGWVIQKIVDEKYIGEAVIDLINTIKSVNDLIYLHQASTSDVFKFEVQMFLKDKNLNVTPDHKITGKTTTHKVDFYYRKKDTDYFMNVISGTNLANKVIRTGFSYYDIKETRKNIDWVSIVNPEDKWSDHSLKLLNQFSTTISWQYKNRLIELLN